MSRVLTFSRIFPGYHPRKGEQTFFVPKIWNSISAKVNYKLICDLNPEAEITPLWRFWRFLNDINSSNSGIKNHTIRAGHRWKAGDWFSPRVWSGVPYRSKQVIIAPDIQVKKTWDLDIEGSDWFIDGRHEYALSGDGFDAGMLANNDGLSRFDMYDWFTMSPDFKRTERFNGQIICWNEKINY